MPIEDLDLKDLFQIDIEAGLVRFGGERALVVDAAAMGVLREELTACLSRALGQDAVARADHPPDPEGQDGRLVFRSREAWARDRAREPRLFHDGAPLDPMGMVARSPAMRQLIDLAQRIAMVDSTVLISGESGTGKERVARMVHNASSRAPGPFIAVNCGAITETLLESELFGHVKGAVTGAMHERPGLFESANGGTLLLDEVGEVSPAMQVKLLRVLQEREIRRVGESTTGPSTSGSSPPPTGN
jgi:DNA-binding NtrC family response regulator